MIKNLFLKDCSLDKNRFLSLESQTDIYTDCNSHERNTEIVEGTSKTPAAAAGTGVKVAIKLKISL